MQRQQFNRAKVIGETWAREGIFDRASANDEKRTVELSFSSEVLVERYYGFEKLSHADGAVNLDRLNSGRANLLVMHAPGDWVGVIESAQVTDKRGRSVVRFGNSPRAQSVFQDVRDGILASVSVGYRVDDIKLTRSGDAGDEYTVTQWTPYEISLVTVPADESVGVGRSAEVLNQALAATPKEQSKMDAPNTAAGAPVDVQVIDHAAPERLRIKSLQTLSRDHKIDDAQRDKWIDEGVTTEEAARKVLDIIAERTKRNPSTVSHVGLTPGETKQYSVTRAISAVINKNWNAAGFELECSRAIAQKLGKVSNEHTFYVPLEIQKRDLIVGTSTMGGYLVSTGNVGFIDLLRNRSVLYRMGAMRLSGLQGSVTVPKITAPGTGYWLATEATAATESQMVIGQMALTPRNLGAYTEISRQLLLQSSPDAEGLVMSDLAQVCGLALDVAGLRGTGTEQPTGVINTSGIGTVTITTGVVTYANVLEFQTDTAVANALAAESGYVTTPAISAILKQKARFANSDTPIWQGGVLDGNIESMRAMSTNQLAAGQLLFGNFGNVVVGEWGVLEIEANPYANFAAGIVGVRAFLTADVGTRYPGGFSLGTGITA
jgi:HK97 family phage major capsid protein/HK97 family phage prohead protease